MPRQIATFGVFLAALLMLGWRASIPGIATGYVDSVAKIQAQDEAVYGSTAFTMATEGGWLTPRFLGRYALYKPPLLYWLNGMSARALGRTAMALRLPFHPGGRRNCSVSVRVGGLAGCSPPRIMPPVLYS